MKKLTFIFDKIIDSLAYVAAAFILYLMIVVGTEIVSRKIFDTSLNWVLESCEHTIYVITFFSAAWLLKNKHHVKTDVVIEMMKPRNRSVLGLVVSIISAGLCLFLAYRAVLSTLDLYQRNMYTTTQLELLMWPLVAVMIIGFLLLSIQFIRDIHASLVDLKGEKNNNQK